jgi:hypothetical protein
MSRRRILGLLTVLTALVALLPLSATTAVAATAGGTGTPIIVLGVPGLRWDDLSPSTTPAMWALARRGATGALVVRAVDETTRPLDGWATLSAGNRARGGLTPEEIRRANRGTLTGAQVGALGSALRAAGICARSQGGPGAALAAADPTRTSGTQNCPVLLVEIDSLAAGNRAAGISNADRTVATALSGVPTSATVLLLGLSDSSTDNSKVSARLHVAIAAGPGFPPGTRLRSASTRRAPFVQLVDVAPTLLSRLGIARPDSMIGQPFETVGPTTADLAGRRTAYLDLDRHARQMHRAVALFFVPLSVAFVLGLAAAAALQGYGRRAAARRVAYGVVFPVAAAPGGAFLADLVPWWRGPVGLIWLAAAVGTAVILAAAALFARRRGPISMIGMVAAVTFGVLTVDLVTGAHLQLSSVPGYDPLIAGRFAGIGNPAFGALAASALVTAFLFARGWRSALAIGAIAVIVDGAPMWGSDVGGVLALVPGVLIVTAAASGRRISWRAIAGGIGASIVAIILLAAVDLARPAGSRTHLGRFASDLLHGHGGTTLHRKFAANWHLLTSNPATVMVPFVLAGLALVVLRAGALRGTDGLAAAYQRIPLLQPGLVACLVTGVLGFLLNDSGVVIPAVMALIVVPVAIVAAIERPAEDPATHRKARGWSGASLIHAYAGIPWTIGLARPVDTSHGGPASA